MTKLIEEFNDFFKGDAEITVKGENLEIAIGRRTLEIAPPHVVGTSSKGS